MRGLPIWTRSSGSKYNLTFLLAFVSLAMGLFTPSAEAAVGRTPGNFAVSPTGAATYTIPIWAPPGPHGVQPTLTLTYDSRQTNGYLGVGWSLSGLSAIYRCNKTTAQDGATGSVTLTSSDVFCMDGKRLRLTSGTYGQAASTYQTEIANFANIFYSATGIFQFTPGVKFKADATYFPPPGLKP